MAGYIGFIDYRIDFHLIIKLLKNYPNVTFVFYGPVHLSCKNEIEHLSKNYDNFKYKGSISYSNVKKAINDFDIGIIPHKRNDFTASMSPLKLYQFLGQGRPIVWGAARKR